MGLERTVTFPAGHVPVWADVAARLAAKGVVVQMRMIDGELAFPDESPPDTWRELRVAFGGAMVTVRRDDAAVRLVGWGNMDEPQKQLWQALAEAFAEAGGTQ
jgi:hypothetical protein